MSYEYLIVNVINHSVDGESADFNMFYNSHDFTV